MNNIIKKFDYRIKNPEPHIVALLAYIDEAKGHFKASFNMSPQAILSLKKSTLITSSGSSTRIEGAKLTDKEVEKIMQGLSISKFAERDYQEVQGYLETLQNVFDNYQNLTFSENLILGLHKELLKYSEKDELQRGRYKQKENLVGILDKDGKVTKIMFETTKAYLTPKEMQELVLWTAESLKEKRFHPLLIIANFIIEFLKIHPFEDGNGRLSRIMTNLLLLQSGYLFCQYVSHEQIIERRKDEYYIALRKSQETFKKENETINPWLNFLLSAIKEQSEKSADLLKENKENLQENLSPNQLKVWEFLIQENEASPLEIAKITKVALPTVRQSLGRLIKIGKIKKIGLGRSTRYKKI